MSETNPYCACLGIAVPRLEAVKHSPDANFYSLLIVALLERGAPITLREAAKRFEEAGVAPAPSALASLKRCKPGRPPVYRDGNHYALDAHDDETDLWAFRLGLRPPRAALVMPAQVEPGPLPSPDQPLRIADLDEAWRDGIAGGWSATRVAVCVLDAHGGAMSPGDVLAFVRARSTWSPLSADSPKFWRHGAAIRVRPDGGWELDLAHDAAPSARRAVRERMEVMRRWAHMRPDPVVVAAHRRRVEQEHADNAERLASMTRVLVHGFPAGRPEAIVLLDIGRRETVTYVGPEIVRARDKLLSYDFIAALNVREFLRTLAFEPCERRLAEMGPPQRTMQINQRGRTLKITTELLVQGSCGISRPFGDAVLMRRYLDRGEYTKLRRRLESDVKALHALYQYGHLHGALRLRWGFLDEMIPAPWVHRDETTLRGLMVRAHEVRATLEVVAGGAPGWADPWARVRRARVQKEEGGWRLWLVDELGDAIDEDDVQLARIGAPLVSVSTLRGGGQ